LINFCGDQARKLVIKDIAVTALASFI